MTYYTRVQHGKRVRYEPCGEARPDMLPVGFWLIQAKPEGGTCTRRIEPDHAALQAAAKALQDRLEPIILKAMEGRPQRSPLTPEEAAAWETLGGVFLFPCAHDVAERIADEIAAYVEVPE